MIGAAKFLMAVAKPILPPPEPPLPPLEPPLLWEPLVRYLNSSSTSGWTISRLAISDSNIVLIKSTVSSSTYSNDSGATFQQCPALVGRNTQGTPASHGDVVCAAQGFPTRAIITSSDGFETIDSEHATTGASMLQIAASNDGDFIGMHYGDFGLIALDNTGAFHNIDLAPNYEDPTINQSEAFIAFSGSDVYLLMGYTPESSNYVIKAPLASFRDGTMSANITQVENRPDATGLFNIGDAVYTIEPSGDIYKLDGNSFVLVTSIPQFVSGRLSSNSAGCVIGQSSTNGICWWFGKDETITQLPNWLDSGATSGSFGMASIANNGKDFVAATDVGYCSISLQENQ